MCLQRGTDWVIKYGSSCLAIQSTQTQQPEHHTFIYFFFYDMFRLYHSMYVSMLCLCGLECLMLNQHNTTMLPKQINLIFVSTLSVCMTLDISTSPSRVSRNIVTAKHEPLVTAHYAELANSQSAIIRNLSAPTASVWLSNLRDIATASLLRMHRILPGSKFIWFPTLATSAQHSNKHALCIAGIIGGWKFASIPLWADKRFWLLQRTIQGWTVRCEVVARLTQALDVCKTSGSNFWCLRHVWGLRTDVT